MSQRRITKMSAHDPRRAARESKRADQRAIVQARPANALTTGARLVLQAQAHGGATLTKAGQRYTPAPGIPAYAVGRAGYGVQLDPYSPLVEVEAQSWVDSIPQGELVGSWLNNGVIYLDRLTICHDEAEALQLAKDTGELAIYDLVTNREISLARALALA